MEKPQIQRINKLKLFKPEIRHLDNGIPLYIFNIGDQQISKIEINIEGGKCDGGNQAISELSASTLREGSLKYNSEEIAEQLDINGCCLGKSTLTHCNAINIHSINRNFENVMPILADMTFNPTFPAKEVNNIKNVAINQLQTKLERVSFLAQTKFSQLCFGRESNLGKPFSCDTIRDTSIDDIKRFHEDWFRTPNIRIMISGMISEEMLNCINTHFGKTPIIGKPRESQTDAATESHKGETIIVDKNNAIQSAIAMGSSTILRSNPDYIPLRILVTALGGYFGSRLMTNIREDKGYTYGISAYLQGFRDSAFITISSQCDTSYTWNVVKEIKSEIGKLQNEPIPSDELSRLKSHMLSDLARILDTPFSIAEYYASMLNNRMPQNYFENQIDIINSITAVDLQAIAQKYLSADDFFTVIAGNSSKLNG